MSVAEVADLPKPCWSACRHLKRFTRSLWPRGVAHRIGATDLHRFVDDRIGDAEQVAERLSERHIQYVDAPVSGGRAGAENGTLTVMVAGAPDAIAWSAPCSMS